MEQLGVQTVLPSRCIKHLPFELETTSTKIPIQQSNEHAFRSPNVSHDLIPAQKGTAACEKREAVKKVVLDFTLTHDTYLAWYMYGILIFLS